MGKDGVRGHGQVQRRDLDKSKVIIITVIGGCETESGGYNYKTTTITTVSIAYSELNSINVY